MLTVPRNIQAIAWDLDGTIIDSFGIFCRLVTQISPGFGLAVPTVEAMAAEYHGSLAESISSVFGGLQPDIVERFEQQFLSEQEQYYLEVDEHILDDAHWLMEQAAEADLKQVIVTNRGHAGRNAASPRYIVEHSRLKPLVNHIICGDEAGEFRKPDPRVFGTLLADWGVSPQDVLVIGDQHVDIELGVNLGSNVILINRGSEAQAKLHVLADGWENHTTIVSSLRDVQFARHAAAA